MPENEPVAQNAPEEALPSKPSREPLLGALLFGTLLIVTIAAVAGAGYALYSGWKSSKERSARPSINELAVKAADPAPAQEAAPAPAETPAAPVADAKQKDVSVMNGGAAKGTAGTVAEMLKQAGYTKVTAGNTVKDYTGTVVYHAAGLEKEAAALKEDLIKKYPATTLQSAVAGNKETSMASLTVIIGK
jgi:hypothetical protein